VIDRCLCRVREEYAHGPDALMDQTRQDAIVLNLLRACEACIDLAMHVVRVRRLGLPETSRAGRGSARGPGRAGCRRGRAPPHPPCVGPRRRGRGRRRRSPRESQCPPRARPGAACAPARARPTALPPGASAGGGRPRRSAGRDRRPRRAPRARARSNPQAPCGLRAGSGARVRMGPPGWSPVPETAGRAGGCVRARAQPRRSPPSSGRPAPPSPGPPSVPASPSLSSSRASSASMRSSSASISASLMGV